MSFIVIAALAGVQNPSDADSGSVSPTQVRERLTSKNSIVLLDVRTEQEYQGESGHIEGARLIPVGELADRLEELKPLAKDTIIVYCRTDNRSRRAVSILRTRGFSALWIKGGITAWNALNYPVVKGRKP